MDTETIDTQTTDTEATMRFSERRSYLIQMRKRYRTAAHVQKTALLDEMQTVTGLHRKHPLRLLRTPLRMQRRPRARQRGVVYDGEVRAAVALIAQALVSPLPSGCNRNWVARPSCWPAKRRSLSPLTWKSNLSTSASPPCAICWPTSCATYCARRQAPLRPRIP